MNVHDTFIAEHHTEHTDDLGVTLWLSAKAITPETMQGDRIATGQTVFQFYTGNGFQRYVILLDFEDWGSERCPRFATYVRAEDGLWELVAPVTTEPYYPKED